MPASGIGLTVPRIPSSTSRKLESGRTMASVRLQVKLRLEIGGGGSVCSPGLGCELVLWRFLFWAVWHISLVFSATVIAVTAASQGVPWKSRMTGHNLHGRLWWPWLDKGTTRGQWVKPEPQSFPVFRSPRGHSGAPREEVLVRWHCRLPGCLWSWAYFGLFKKSDPLRHQLALAKLTEVRFAWKMTWLHQHPQCL